MSFLGININDECDWCGKDPCCCNPPTKEQVLELERKLQQMEIENSEEYLKNNKKPILGDANQYIKYL